MNQKERDFLESYDRGDKCSGEMLIYGSVGKIVSEIKGNEHRWQREMTTVVEIGGRYFAVDWMRGLTECQENEYDGVPYEVRKEQHEQTVIVTNWVKI